jgi:hypothetical protein
MSTLRSPALVISGRHRDRAPGAPFPYTGRVEYSGTVLESTDSHDGVVGMQPMKRQTLRLSYKEYEEPGIGTLLRGLWTSR